MIRVRVTPRAEGLEVLAEGHADYAPRGQDVVCAGVSALLFCYLSYMDSLPPIATAEGASTLEQEQREGYLWIRTRGWEGRDRDAWRVVEAGLALLAEAYPAFVSMDAPTQKEGAEV